MLQWSSVVPRDGDQLRLDLFQGEPWDGRSPRYLTRARNALFLRQKPPPHEVRTTDPLQYDLWPAERGEMKRNAPSGHVRDGAPLLFARKRPRRGSIKRERWYYDGS